MKEVIAVNDNAPPSQSTAIAEVTDLRVSLRRGGTRIQALNGVSLSIAPGEIVALVGESGSGKSVLGMSLLGLLPRKSQPRVTGSITVLGQDMTKISSRALQRLRRHKLSAVFQDPMTSLNPSMKISNQLIEVTRDSEKAKASLLEVRIADPVGVLKRYPFELSGGQRQRVMIAMAFAKEPALVVADEPTTALDVTVQAQILRLIRDLRENFGTGFLFITHDLGVAAEIADTIVVLYGGRILEQGPANEILAAARHPYTRALVGARLTMEQDRSQPLSIGQREPSGALAPALGCPYADRCEAVLPICHDVFPGAATISNSWRIYCHNPTAPMTSAVAISASPTKATEGQAGDDGKMTVLEAIGIEKVFKARGSSKVLDRQALINVDLRLHRGEVVAVVGESGSGKSTLLRILADLDAPSSGSITRGSGPMPKMVFQDAGASLTPWMSVEDLLKESLLKAGLSRSEVAERVQAVVNAVGLAPSVLSAKAGALSGGQRQRVAIARCVVAPPPVLLCDEPTSALDASLVAGTLNLLLSLKDSLHMAMVFVTHDLAVARFVATRIMVMFAGRVVEEGLSEDLCASPRHPYTKMLVASLPGQGRDRQSTISDASYDAPSQGCAFQLRCPEAAEICFAKRPPAVRFHDHGQVSCHFVKVAES